MTILLIDHWRGLVSYIFTLDWTVNGLDWSLCGCDGLTNSNLKKQYANWFWWQQTFVLDVCCWSTLGWNFGHDGFKSLNFADLFFLKLVRRETIWHASENISLTFSWLPWRFSQHSYQDSCALHKQWSMWWITWDLCAGLCGKSGIHPSRLVFVK